MLKKIAFGLFFGLSSVVSYADEGLGLKYTEAFEKSKKEQKPLVVLISAGWCPSCNTMKSETLEPMKKDGSFKNVVIAVVDVDREPELVRQLYLINEKTNERILSLPQIMVYTPPQDEPKEESKRFGLVGQQGRLRILELLKKVLMK